MPQALQRAPFTTGEATLASGLPEDLLQEEGPLVQLLRHALPAAMAIHAFGSRIKGQARPDSDPDLAVLVEGYADPLQLWDLSHQLAALAGCPVDLLDLRAASTVMQYQVLTQGTRLWARDMQADLFACYVMAEKLDLDAARAGTLADIAQSGRIYGR